MGTGLYQRTETISIGFAKIAANRRVTGRRPAQLAVLDDADAAEGQQRLRGVPHGLGEQGFDFGCDIMNATADCINRGLFVADCR